MLPREVLIERDRSAAVRTFKELLERVNAVQGVPFAELAAAHEISWQTEPARNKGLAGRIVEASMGIEANPRAEADLTYLGLEIKTIPIAEDLKVLERTKVTMLNFQDVHDQPFEGSTVEHKLRSIIFVPIVKFELDRPDRWYIRSPFIWFPSNAAYEQLKRDYEEVRALLREGKVDALSSEKPPKGQGVFLTPNTAGKDSRDMTAYYLDEPRTRKVLTKRRSWMLRKEFTTEVIRENVGYRPVTPEREVVATTVASLRDGP